MSKGRKVIVWILASLVVLVLVAFAAVKIFFPADKVSRMIVENLQESLQRPVSIEKTSVSIWGGIGLVVENLEVKNLPGFKRENFFQLDKLDVKVKFWPLLGGDIEFSRIGLNDLTANLEKNSAGVLNFSDLGEHEQKEVTPEAGASSVPFLFDQLSVGQASINYYDDSTGTQLSLRGIDLSSKMTRNAYDKTLSALGDLSVDSLIIEDTSGVLDFPHLDLTADLHLTLSEQDELLLIDRIQIELSDMEGLLDGRIENLFSEPDVEVNFRSKRFTVEDLLSLLPEKVLASLEGIESTGEMFASASLKGIPGKAGALDFDARLSVDRISVSMPDIRGDLVVEAGELNIKQKAANLLFNNCTFAGEPISINVFVKNIFEPVINADLSLTVNFNSFEDYSAEIKKLSGRAYLTCNLYSDIQRLETTRLDGGLVVEDFRLYHDKLTQPVEEIELDCEFKQKHIEIKSMEAEIGSSSFKLDGRMSDIVPYLADPTNATVKPDINFELNSPYLNLDELIALVKIDSTQIEKESPAEDSLSAKMMTDITAMGELDIKRAVYALVEIDNFKGFLDFRDNVLHLEQAEAKVYQGDLNGEVIVDYENPENPQFMLDFKADRMNLNSAMTRVTSLDDVIFGEANLSSSFSGKIGDPAEVLRQLTANGEMLVSDGELKNFPLLKQITDKLGFKAYESSEFRDLQSRFKVEDGRVKLDDLKFSMGQSNWTFDGSVGFDGSLDYDVAIELPNSMVSGSGLLSDLDSFLGGGDKRLTIPIHLGGNYNSPQIKVDRSKLLESADKKIKDKGKDLLDNLLKQD